VSSVSLWQLSLRTKFNSMEHKHRLASSPVLWACLAWLVTPKLNSMLELLGAGQTPQLQKIQLHGVFVCLVCFRHDLQWFKFEAISIGK
jgi:hypothetical protein